MKRLAVNVNETISRWENEQLGYMSRILARGGSVQTVTYPTGKQKVRAIHAPHCSLNGQQEDMPEVNISTYQKFVSA